jgi:hypothetical protein
MIIKSFALPLFILFTPALEENSNPAAVIEPLAINTNSSQQINEEVLNISQAKIVPDSLFNRYYKATGGQPVWEGIKTFSAKQKVTSPSAVSYDVILNGDLQEQAVHKSRIAMKREFIYVSKPQDGWLKIPLGGTDKATKYQVNGLNATEKANLTTEMYNALAPFYNYKNRGLIASYVGSETINGKKVDHVELQGKGVIYNLYFDSESHLLTQAKEKSGGTEFVRTYSDYVKSKSGITYPSKIVEVNAKDKKSTTISVSDLVINPVLDKALFQK